MFKFILLFFSITSISLADEIDDKCKQLVRLHSYMKLDMLMKDRKITTNYGCQSIPELKSLFEEELKSKARFCKLIENEKDLVLKKEKFEKMTKPFREDDEKENLIPETKKLVSKYIYGRYENSESCLRKELGQEIESYISSGDLLVVQAEACYKFTNHLQKIKLQYECF